jgi:hypothetical protein
MTRRARSIVGSLAAVTLLGAATAGCRTVYPPVTVTRDRYVPLDHDYEGWPPARQSPSQPERPPEPVVLTVTPWVTRTATCYAPGQVWAPGSAHHRASRRHTRRPAGCTPRRRGARHSARRTYRHSSRRGASHGWRQGRAWSRRVSHHVR